MLTRCIAVTLSLALAAPTVAIAQAPQNCATIADRFDRETRAFTAEAERQNLDFVKQLALDKITGALKQRLQEPFRDTIAGDIAQHVNDNWDAANAARERLTRARDYLNEWIACFTAPLGTCDRAALNQRYRDEFKAYMDSLLDEAGVGEARARVDRARSLLHNYLDRTMNISVGTMKAMADCTAPMTRQARVELTSAETPTATPEALPEIPEPPSKPVDPPKSGGSIGKFALIMGAVVGGAAAAGTAFKPQDPSGSETSGTSTPTTTTSSSGVRAYDGTYDLDVVVTGAGGTNTTRRFSQYLIISSGIVTTTQRDLSGTVSSGGVFQAVGSCPINPDPADWRGTMQSNGTGRGNYTCRNGGISREWTAIRR